MTNTICMAPWLDCSFVRLRPRLHVNQKKVVFKIVCDFDVEFVTRVRRFDCYCYCDFFIIVIIMIAHWGT